VNAISHSKKGIFIFNNSFSVTLKTILVYRKPEFLNHNGAEACVAISAYKKPPYEAAFIILKHQAVVMYFKHFSILKDVNA